MTSSNSRWTLLRSSVPLAAFAALASLASPPALADDRDVLRDAAARPFVFVLLDNSGSMNRRPPCDQDDIDDGKCNQEDFCEDDLGCRLPLEGDDSKSKFRIAREALEEVLKEVSDVDFGFATMNQNELRVKEKHWLYQVAASQADGFFSLAGSTTFPTANSYETFGAAAGCDTTQSTDDSDVGCMPIGPGDCGGGANQYCAPADTNDTWEMERFRRLPRKGAGGSLSTSYYLRASTTRYKVTYGGSVTYADTGSISVPVTIETCDNAICTTITAGSAVTKNITYDAVGQYLIHDPTVDRTGDAREVGWIGYQDAEVTDSSAVCDWEGNLDAANDTINGYSLNWPDLDPADPWDPHIDDPSDRYISCALDPPATSAQETFTEGDVLPFDWEDSHLDELLEHLASQRYPAPDGDSTDDFGVATYFNDIQQGTDTFLRYESEADRVLVPVGNQDLGYAIRGFRQWYSGCDHGHCGDDELGWDDLAARCDPKWACRQKFLLILTDGDTDDDTETCHPSPSACSATASMRAQSGIQTFVVAFGRENSGHNVLNCLASNTHSQDPIYPRNKEQLVAALTEIIGRVREQAAAFASAAVPQVQANATDKIFLSSFTPLNDTAYWAGRLDAFLKPLPLLPGGEPDRSTVCDSDTQSECWLWDAGDVQEGHLGGDGTYAPGRLLLQAPHPDELAAAPPWDPDQLQLGTEVDERRVVYSYFPGDATTGNRRLFTYPEDTETAVKYDLWDGMGISFIVGDTASEDAANDEANAVIATTLVEKEGTVDIADPNDPDTIIQSPITYLMGDIFHADPVVLSRPNSFVLYSSDPYLNKPLCGAPADPDRDPPPSYRWFADKNFCRRSLILAASNDGQLHVFDGGIFKAVGGDPAECLLPAKDLDGDGTASTDEFEVGMYDENDAVDGFLTCTADVDCGTGPCIGGQCRDVKVGILDGAYDNGTGREVFSFIPRAMLKTIHGMANGLDRNFDFWGMDASPRVDDVFIDPLASESDVDEPVCLNREWRTVLIGGYREGGPGLYALDITQPDTLDSDHVTQAGGSPAYVPTCFDGGVGCSRPYPSVLWEFQDEATVDTGGGTFVTSKLDEDLNDAVDLANSWSRVSTGRIRVCTENCDSIDPDDPAESEDRFVAVFGGGVGDAPTNDTGNYLYIVDIETGQTIYKQPVVGAVPSDVAAIDSNGDGYLDRLYAGTTAGFVYKVLLESNTASPHRLVSQTIQTRIGGSNHNLSVLRLQGPSGDTNKYRPFQVFSTGGKPIYHEISAVFVASQNRVAMAFGTGNRWNLWDASGQEGRFYVVLDDNYTDTDRNGVVNVTCAGCAQPLTESSFIGIDPQAAFDASNPINYLFSGAGGDTLRGWYYTLDANEKVITEAFSLAGVTIFTSFVPTEVANSDGTCSRAGTSRIFIVGTVTAIGYAIPPGGTIADRFRYTEISQFTTPPFVEQSATANPEGGGGSTTHADFVTESLAVIREELKTLQSARCRYANYTQNIKTIRSDTGVVFVAPIPLCMDPISWKEF